MFVSSLLVLTLAISMVLIGSKIKPLQKVMGIAKNKLMFSSVLRSQIQTYFPTCLISISFLYSDYTQPFQKDRMLQTTTGSEPQILIEYIKAYILITLPLFSWLFLKSNYAQLSQPAFQAKFGTLYQSVSPFKISAYMFFTFFFIRRLAVAVCTVVWARTLILQIYTTIFGSLFILKFYIEKRPMDSTLQNKLEIFNEGFTLLSNYLLIIFTDFVSIEKRYDLGFLAIYLILIVCSLNIAGVLLNLILTLRLAYLKQKHQKAWDKYHEVNNKMLKFILWDFMEVTGTKLNSSQM